MLPDALDDFSAYEHAQALKEEKLPHCDMCGEPIHEGDMMYSIEGKTLCIECLDWMYGESVTDYMNDNFY